MEFRSRITYVRESIASYLTARMALSFMSTALFIIFLAANGFISCSGEEGSEGQWTPVHRDISWEFLPPLDLAPLNSEETQEEEAGGILPEPKSVAVLRFPGEDGQTNVMQFADMVDEIDQNSEQFFKVVIVMDSGGGFVSDYGFLHDQVVRLRGKKLQIEVCVDRIAASGGYWAILPADKIYAASTAIIGSIGAFHVKVDATQMFQSLGVHIEVFRAGKEKADLSPLVPTGEEQSERLQRDAELIQDHFIELLTLWRPNTNIEKAQSAGTWLGVDAVKPHLGLVDEILTCHELLLRERQTRQLVEFKHGVSLGDWLGGLMGNAGARVVTELLQAQVSRY